MAQENMNIQWYPGHMTKTRRQIEADLKLVDAVCEIVDARIPISSRNPDIDAICGAKPRIVILNRMDLADPNGTRRWTEYFKAKGIAAVPVDCKSRRGIGDFQTAVQTVLKEKSERNAAKGMQKPVRIRIHPHQSNFRQKGCQGGKPTRRHPRQAVGDGESDPAAVGYPRYPLAQV